MLLAAGRGTRLGAGRPKALVPLGRGPHAAPVVVHALQAALACRTLTSVVVVAPPDPEGMAQLTSAVDAAALPTPTGRHRTVGSATPDGRQCHTGRSPVSDQAVGSATPDGRQCHIQVVPGGAERADSVAAGLAALPADIDVVLVHDAARALTPVEVFDRVIEAVRSGHEAVTPALPVTDTIKQVTSAVPGRNGVETVVATIDRATLRAVQTPQGFRREILERAHSEVRYAVTDDCGMVEALGGRVTVVPGAPRAMKITTPHDLALAAGWLEEDEESSP